MCNAGPKVSKEEISFGNVGEHGGNGKMYLLNKGVRVCGSR
jgi:hypothetical protein